MQTKLPVTQHEYQFPGNETLLSTTDTSSHIGYANAAPMRRNGQITGYLPVRTKPSRADVEAARAGEQGSSFAVVASEVRSLAGRSAAAAKEIKGLIDTSVANVESGPRLMAEITSASQEQSLGISQVGQAVAQLDEMTRQNTAMVEQSSASAISMGDQALRLVAAVKVFSIWAGATQLPGDAMDKTIPDPHDVASQQAALLDAADALNALRDYQFGMDSTTRRAVAERGQELIDKVRGT